MTYSAPAPATTTDHAKLMQKSANDISLVLTSPSRTQMAEMGLLERGYTLPSGICGWYVGVVCKYPAAPSLLENKDG